MSTSLRSAVIDWSQGMPFAPAFGDVYFSRAGGDAETRYVFLQQNRLPERLAVLPDGDAFTIVETGFGTGLNWLATLALWRQSGSKGWLHFASVEKFPLTLADLARAQSFWPDHADAASRLQADYPPLLPGFHRLCFPEWRATLTLFFGDVADFLPRLQAKADAWFLDGFAPDRNPDMWSEKLFRGMAALSRPGTTFATFTAAGRVRRGLAAAGFEVEKIPGFGQKREMLRGAFAGTGNTASAANFSSAKPWLQRPTFSPATKKACVIGAGIAGAQTAHRLALRGWEVTVLERGQPAGAASGNPAAVIYPRLAPQSQAPDHFPQQAWLFAQRQLSQLSNENSPWHPCGLLQLASGNQREAAKKIAQQDWPADLVSLLTPAQATQKAGIEIGTEALCFPQAGWLETEKFCHRLLAHPAITLRSETDVARLDQTRAGWNLYDRKGELLLESPVVIVANACDAVRFAQLEKLPLQPVAGQVSLPEATPASSALACVICHDGYLTPRLPGGRHCLGATFHPGQTDCRATVADHEENLRLLQQALPGFSEALPDIADWQGRAALRCQSPDYLPLLGPVADYAAFRQSYAGMKDGKVQPYPDLLALPGLYVNLAHGSKGFGQAALAAEILAAELNGEPAPVSRITLDALHPMRFWMRQLKREK